ncbi:MAG: SDR family oxidoreductase [Pseudomonadota bacterium]
MPSVIITGASSGLGTSLARRYAARGAVLGLVARRNDALQQLAAQIGPNAVACNADVRDPVAMQRAAQDFMQRFGCPDVVIANAGVSVGTLTEFAEDTEVFDEIIATNIIGMVHTFQPFIAAMRARGNGALVGIASVAGLRGLPGAGAYSASKAAAIAYLESLRVELRGSGIAVITICPGYIKTPMTETNPYRMPFIMQPEIAAEKIIVAIKRKKTFAVIPWQMAWVGWVLKRLPNALYDRLFARAPHKPRRS